MSEEIQYRKTISHTLVLHDPLSHGHILPMSKGKWLWWQSRCFSVRSFCKMLHKMFAEIRGKRREWPSPSLTIYAAHLCGMSAIEKCTAIALRRTSFSSDPQTVNNAMFLKRTEEIQFFFQSPNCQQYFMIFKPF